MRVSVYSKRYQNMYKCTKPIFNCSRLYLVIDIIVFFWPDRHLQIAILSLVFSFLFVKQHCWYFSICLRTFRFWDIVKTYDSRFLHNGRNGIAVGTNEDYEKSFSFSLSMLVPQTSIITAACLNPSASRSDINSKLSTSARLTGREHDPPHPPYSS